MSKEIKQTNYNLDDLRNYIVEHEEKYLNKTNEKSLSRLISKKNYIDRRYVSNCNELGVNIRIGDICYIDYGEAYIYETGFQHFGLVLNIFHNKAFVVPMSGNYNEYIKAYGKYNKQGKKHLMRLGKLKGMNKESFLFLNDAKWINTARIIDVKSHLNQNGKLFNEIMDREIKCILYIHD